MSEALPPSTAAQWISLDHADYERPTPDDDMRAVERLIAAAVVQASRAVEHMLTPWIVASRPTDTGEWAA